MTDNCSCRSLTSEMFSLVSVDIQMLLPLRICCDMISLFRVIFFSFLNVFLLNTVCSIFSALNREFTLSVAIDSYDVKSPPLSISLFEFLLGMFVILSCLLLIVFFPPLIVMSPAVIEVLMLPTLALSDCVILVTQMGKGC